MRNVVDIAPLRHKEARTLASVELERFIALVESLSADEWSQPTYCRLWNVRQIVCHQAGAYAGFAKWAEFRRQWMAIPQPKAGQLAVDVINDIQVADRAKATPAELIAELRQVGPIAIANRQRIPAFMRGLRFEAGRFLRAWRPSDMLSALRRPYGPTAIFFNDQKRDFQGEIRLDYITDLIYTRDTWMHRMDIALATGRELVLTAEHDGRMMELVMRDLGEQLSHFLGAKTIAYDLPGVGGGCYKIGPASTPDATLQIELPYFNVLASGRISADEAMAQGLISISGDQATAHVALYHMAPLLY